MLLVMFHYGFNNYLISNQITSVKVEKIIGTKEAEVPKNFTIPVETVDSEKGLYQQIQVLFKFKSEYVLCGNQQHKRFKSYNDEEYMEYIVV